MNREVEDGWMDPLWYSVPPLSIFFKMSPWFMEIRRTSICNSIVVSQLNELV